MNKSRIEILFRTNQLTENYKLTLLLLQAEEAREHCKSCQIDVGERRVDLANTKSDIITQIREMVSQCDLTLKAVSFCLLSLNVC